MYDKAISKILSSTLGNLRKMEPMVKDVSAGFSRDVDVPGSPPRRRSLHEQAVVGTSAPEIPCSRNHRVAVPMWPPRSST